MFSEMGLFYKGSIFFEAFCTKKWMNKEIPVERGLLKDTDIRFFDVNYEKFTLIFSDPDSILTYMPEDIDWRIPKPPAELVYIGWYLSRKNAMHAYFITRQNDTMRILVAEAEVKGDKIYCAPPRIQARPRECTVFFVPTREYILLNNDSCKFVASTEEDTELAHTLKGKDDRLAVLVIARNPHALTYTDMPKVILTDPFQPWAFRLLMVPAEILRRVNIKAPLFFFLFFLLIALLIMH